MENLILLVCQIENNQLFILSILPILLHLVVLYKFRNFAD